MCRIIMRLPSMHFASPGYQSPEPYCEEHQEPVTGGQLCIVGKIEKVVDDKLKALRGEGDAAPS